MTFIENLNNEIKEAMKARNSLRLDTLRMLKSKILNVNARGDVPEPEILKIFKTYAGSLQEALEQAISVNRLEIADKLKEEIAIIQEFLPQALSHEETEKLIKQIIQESGYKTKKDSGLVMKALMQLNNTVDGKIAKKMVDQLLED